MIALTVTALIAIVAFATALTLADNWIRGRAVLTELMHERALARAGFVPVVSAAELRPRTPTQLRSRFSERLSPNVPRSRAGASTAFAKRTLRAPRPAIAPLGEALGAA